MQKTIRLFHKAYAFTLVVGLLLLVFLPVFGFAAQPTGSITLHCVFHDQKQDVIFAGDTYALAKVADATLDPNTNTLSYETTAAFSSYACDWHACTSSQLRAKAYSLKQFVQQESVPVQTGLTDAAGEVCFSGLTPGLYLLYRTEARGKNAKYADMPALISVPQILGQDVNYDVDAYPKFGEDIPQPPSKPDVPTTSPTAPHKPEQPDNTPKKPELPNTGQLTWPIPYLLTFGLGFFAAGLLMRKRTEKEQSETK